MGAIADGVEPEVESVRRKSRREDLHGHRTGHDQEHPFAKPTVSYRPDAFTPPSYRPPSVTTLDEAPHPKELCACTVSDQFGVQSTVKLAVSVVPDTVCVDVPMPSLPVMVTRYWSIGLLPGSAACQVATRVSVGPVGSGIAQLAVTPVGAEGGTVAGAVARVMEVDAGLEPLTAVSYEFLKNAICPNGFRALSTFAI